MPAKKFTDEEILNWLKVGHSVDWIHQLKNVSVKRIKKLRDSNDLSVFPVKLDSPHARLHGVEQSAANGVEVGGVFDFPPKKDPEFRLVPYQLFMELFIAACARGIPRALIKKCLEEIQ